MPAPGRDPPVRQTAITRPIPAPALRQNQLTCKASQQTLAQRQAVIIADPAGCLFYSFLAPTLALPYHTTGFPGDTPLRWARSAPDFDHARAGLYVMFLGSRAAARIVTCAWAVAGGWLFEDTCTSVVL